MQLERYSMGIGDRFGRQGKAQLRAFLSAKEKGVEITPVWNKSHREHTIIGTSPQDVRTEADAATAAAGWTDPYRVDADHIGLANVDLFLSSSDFFTLDVADFTGQPAEEDDIQAFLSVHGELIGEVCVSGIEDPVSIDRADAEQIVRKYLLAVQEVGKIYRHIEENKGTDTFITEVSMDETDQPQSPVEMLFILAMIADEKIPAQTIAPKFTGRFNKGVEYVGDVAQLVREFEQDVAVIAFCIHQYGLPANLKLSVHSGSDKFALYPEIARILRKHDAGVHLKTAGTTWLEELIGLAEAGGDGLQIARDVYRAAFGRFDELCKPYATVIDIDNEALPQPDTVDGWDGAEFASSLRHDQSNPLFNPSLRQMLHVAYKVAAEMGDRYLDALAAYEAKIAEHVSKNLYERHAKPLFVAS